MGGSKVGAVSLIGFAVGGIAWFALELVPPGLGFEDTDDPATSLRFLREHAEVWAQAGVVLILMGLALTADAGVSPGMAPGVVSRGRGDPGGRTPVGWGLRGRFEHGRAHGSTRAVETGG